MSARARYAAAVSVILASLAACRAAARHDVPLPPQLVVAAGASDVKTTNRADGTIALIYRLNDRIQPTDSWPASAPERTTCPETRRMMRPRCTSNKRLERRTRYG